MQTRTARPAATEGIQHPGAGSGWAVACERAFAAFAVMIYLGIHLGLNSVAVGDELSAPDAMAMINQAVVLLGTVALAIRHRAAWLAGLADVWPFFAFLAFAAASWLWSQSPEASLRRSLTLATLITFTVYAHAVLGTLVICRIQVGVTWVVAFASFAAAALLPSSGFDIADYAGAIRGVFTQKNSLGDAMVVGLVALAFVVLHRGRVTAGDVACMALAFITCRLAQATTSFLLCGLVVGATATVLLLLDGGALAGFGLLTGVLAVCLLLVTVLGAQVDLLAIIGKDGTLTGRTDIWAAVRNAMAGHEMLGFGYSAFWLPDAHASNDVWTALGWNTPSAHSGYLETQLELGRIGLALIGGLALWTILVACTAALASYPSTAGSTLILLGVAAIYNYDESSLPRPDIHLLQWIVMFAACVRASRLERGALRGTVVP